MGKNRGLKEGSESLEFPEQYIVKYGFQGIKGHLSSHPVCGLRKWAFTKGVSGTSLERQLV